MRFVGVITPTKRMYSLIIANLLLAQLLIFKLEV